MAHRAINVRPVSNGIWVRATWPEQDLAVYLEVAESWEVGVSFSGEPAAFLAGNFGVEAGFSRTVTKKSVHKPCVKMCRLDIRFDLNFLML
jgi:hypothetical protein